MQVQESLLSSHSSQLGTASVHLEESQSEKATSSTPSSHTGPARKQFLFSSLIIVHPTSESKSESRIDMVSPSHPPTFLTICQKTKTVSLLAMYQPLFQHSSRRASPGNTYPPPTSCHAHLPRSTFRLHPYPQGNLLGGHLLTSQPSSPRLPSCPFAPMRGS
jgi:hypothetical protein